MLKALFGYKIRSSHDNSPIRKAWPLLLHRPTGQIRSTGKERSPQSQWQQLKWTWRAWFQFILLPTRSAFVSFSVWQEGMWPTRRLDLISCTWLNCDTLFSHTLSLFSAPSAGQACALEQLCPGAKPKGGDRRCPRGCLQCWGWKPAPAR